LRGCVGYVVGVLPREGSVCDRGVEGLRDDMLSSEVLLNWRASMLASLMISLELGRVRVCSAVWCEGVCMWRVSTAAERERCWRSSSSSLVWLSSASSLDGSEASREGRVVAAGAERVVERSDMASRRWRSSACWESSRAAVEEAVEDGMSGAVMAASCEKA
jgi:hypothetical protein